MITNTKRTIGLRATAAERESWESAARQDGRTLPAWIVRRCNGEPTTAPVQPAQSSAGTSDESKRNTNDATMGVDAREAKQHKGHEQAPQSRAVQLRKPIAATPAQQPRVEDIPRGLGR